MLDSPVKPKMPRAWFMLTHCTNTTQITQLRKPAYESRAMKQRALAMRMQFL